MIAGWEYGIPWWALVRLAGALSAVVAVCAIVTMFRDIRHRRPWPLCEGWRWLTLGAPLLFAWPALAMICFGLTALDAALLAALYTTLAAAFLIAVHQMTPPDTR